MTRYYYTDPLAAAWMAKHFGMRLVCYATEAQAADYDCPVGEEWPWLETCPADSIEMVEDALAFLEKSGNPIYIHPDSLHLLEPKVGDILQSESPPYWPSMLAMQTDGFPNKGSRILNRNNLPFHWPQSEAS